MLSPKNVSRGKYPTRDRHCTDILCVLLYIAFFGFWISGTIYGFSKGSLKNVAQPVDSVGSLCGIGNATGFPYLYFVVPKSLNFTLKTSVCISGCPSSTSTSIDCLPNKNLTRCEDAFVYETIKVANRYCLPVSKEVYKQIKSRLSGV